MKVTRIGDDDKIDTSQYITRSQGDKRYVNEGENIDAATLTFKQSLNMNNNKITNCKEAENEGDVCTIKNLTAYHRKGAILDMQSKQIKNVQDGVDDSDVCTLQQARSLITSNSSRMVVLNIKIVGSNKYMYYILKSFPKTEYVHILSWMIKNPSDNKFHELHKTSEMGYVNVYIMEDVHDIHPLLSIKAEESVVDPVNGLDTSQFSYKNGIIFYSEKTPSVSLKHYYIKENNINWIYLRVVYLTCQLNE